MSGWSGRKVLVTGAGGFIGSHLTELLTGEGAEVRAFIHYNSRSDWANLDQLHPAVRSELDVVSGDIQDPFAVRRAVEGTEVVFHLAALIGIPYSYVAPQSYVTTNVLGTVNVLEAVRSEGTERMVHTSTSENYGEIQYSPIDERHPLQGRSPYSASKIGADQMAGSYFRAFGSPVSTLRPFNTFGPRQSLRAVIPTIAAQALSGPSVRLGSLSPIRDLTFVEDTARAFLAVAENDTAGLTLNAGNGKGISIGDLARLVIEVAGADAEVVADEEERVRPDASEVPELVCDSTRLRELTGWAPRVTLREGVERTVEWVRENLSGMKADVYNV
jgi:NAD dependent epimerase/dehydratase